MPHVSPQSRIRPLLPWWLPHGPNCPDQGPVSRFYQCGCGGVEVCRFGGVTVWRFGGLWKNQCRWYILILVTLPWWNANPGPTCRPIFCRKLCRRPELWRLFAPVKTCKYRRATCPTIFRHVYSLQSYLSGTRFPGDMTSCGHAPPGGVLGHPLNLE